MARKLPWSAGAAVESGNATSKRSKTMLAKTEMSEDTKRPTTPELTTHVSRRRTTARSPSTSPIHPPSPQAAHVIEPMHPGLHADDRYILVEDEFESLARQFTAHLHAAEYARLERIARSAPPKPLPEISPRMQRTTKLSLERQRLLSRQGTGMNEITRRARDAVAQLGGDSDGDEDLEKKGGDPWTGTSLAGLMGERSQNKMSLIGLQRMESGTRAARGFARGTGISREGTGNACGMLWVGNSEEDEDDVPFGTHRRGVVKRQHAISTDDEVEIEVDSDLPFQRRGKRPAKVQSRADIIYMENDEDEIPFDIRRSCAVKRQRGIGVDNITQPTSPQHRNAAILARKRPLPNGDDHTSYHTSYHRSTHHPTSRSDGNSHSLSRQQIQTFKSKPRPQPLHTFLDDMDDFDDIDAKSAVHASSNSVSTSTKAQAKVKAGATTISRRSGKIDSKKDRRSRLDEVPVFLA